MQTQNKLNYVAVSNNLLQHVKQLPNSNYVFVAIKQLLRQALFYARLHNTNANNGNMQYIQPVTSKALAYSCINNANMLNNMLFSHCNIRLHIQTLLYGIYQLNNGKVLKQLHVAPRQPQRHTNIISKNVGGNTANKKAAVTRQPHGHHNNMYGANYGNKVFSMVKSSAANIKANKLLLLTATVSNVNYNYFNSCKVPSIANNSKAKARRYIAKIIANNVKYATYG